MPRARSSNAHQFYDYIVQSADPLATIRAMENASPPKCENEHFDCKAAESGKQFGDGDVKRIWSEALSGFANNAGGVLIWGLDARGKSDVDGVIGENPISRPEALASRLTELLRDATDPPVIGVEIKPIHDPLTRAGFVVCLIPESAESPHQAIFLPGKPFIYRHADNFRQMDRRMLLRMFYPQFVPNLQFRVTPTLNYQGRNPPDLLLKLTVEIKNVGTGTAKDVFAIVRLSPKPMTLRPEIRESIGDTTNSGHWDEQSMSEGLAYRAKLPLHPEVSSRIFTRTWRHRAEPVKGKYVLAFDTVEMSVTAYAESMPPHQSTVIITAEELMAENSKVIEAVPIE